MATFEDSVLHPVTEFDPADLGSRLAEIVNATDNRALLAARHLLGPLQRYTDPETAEASVRRAQAIYAGGIHQIFVPVGDEGSPEGLATIYPGLELKGLHLPIPLGVFDHEAVRFLANRYKTIQKLASAQWWTDFDYANPNVTAWTSANQEALFARVHKELDEQIDPTQANCAVRPWTIEPHRSPRYIHKAIGATSMRQIARWRRFDDQESRGRLPPRSDLYARLHSEWWTSHGRQKELRVGQISWIDDINQTVAMNAINHDANP